MKLRMLNMSLPYQGFKICPRVRSFHQFIVPSKKNSQYIPFSGIGLTINKPIDLRARQIFTSSLLLENEKGNSLCLNKGDQSYFDFKELECNASAERRLSHFMALMCEVFQLTEEEAEDIIEYYPFLWKEFCQKTFNHLKFLGIEKSTFVQYPWLISMSPEEIDSKLHIVSKAFPDLENINVCAILFKYPNEKLELLFSNWKKEAIEFEHPSKFHFLADALKVPIGEILNQLQTKNFLLSFPYSRIREGVNLCLQAGVQREDLMKDLWVLRNRPAKIRNRIETLLQSRIPVKPWVLRTSIESFETHIQEYWQEKDAIESDRNISSFLVTRLKCDPTDVEKMLKVFPNLKRATVKRVKPNLDYLLIEKGVSPTTIIMTPRLLCQKFEILKERMEKLEASGIKYSSLWMVCRSQRDFDAFLLRWSDCN